ncbi:alpha/beta fold hydrolase [Aquisphaera insulae]|uniref:alpha/beta fold hydrolase n=1 Tax=Aquisphaera insulae TaxID=2712864 RepID=UPI0013E9C5C3|nr:alpha/beta hydrolase [Aquisphaera insulae]
MSEGFRLGYRIEGEGPNALVVGSAVYYPRVFSAGLRKHLRLAFLDHRGFAPPPGDVELSAFALEKIVGDMERARQALGLGRIVVIGHSGHAYMALAYAKAHPEHVSHVVMIGISPNLSAAGGAAAERHWRESASPERKAALEASMRRSPDSVLAALPPGERFIRGYLREGPRTWYDFRFDGTPLWAGVEVNARMMDHVWGVVFRDIDITQGLDAFDRPVLLALGRYDFTVAPPSSWDPIRPRIRDLTLRVFERSGHVPPLEEPDLFDAELLRWLASRP